MGYEYINCKRKNPLNVGELSNIGDENFSLIDCEPKDFYAFRGDPEDLKEMHTIIDCEDDVVAIVPKKHSKFLFHVLEWAMSSYPTIHPDEDLSKNNTPYGPTLKEEKAELRPYLEIEVLLPDPRMENGARIWSHPERVEVGGVAILNDGRVFVVINDEDMVAKMRSGIPQKVTYDYEDDGQKLEVVFECVVSRS